MKAWQAAGRSLPLRPMAAKTPNPALKSRDYTASGILDMEREAIFARGWVSIGLGSNIRPGSAQPIEAGGIPLLLTRTREGTLQVFHNICRHRGLRLVGEPCEGLRELTCPYHAWRYTLAGKFVGAPYFSGKKGTKLPEAEAESLGLVSIEHHVFFDVIFVNLSGTAMDFGEWIAPLAKLWRPFDTGRHCLLSMTEYQIEANWKLVCENFLDNYHVPFVHGQAGGPETAVNFEDVALAGDIFGFILPRGEADKPKPLWLPRLDLPAETQDAQFLFCLFPNTLLIMTAGWFQAISVQPSRADFSVEFLGLYLMDTISDQDRAAANEFSEFMNHINAQDAAILRELQAGRLSPIAEHGSMAPYWDETVQRFQARVRSAYDEAEKGSA